MTEHGQRLADEAKEREDAKEAFKDDFKEHTMILSRDSISKLHGFMRKNKNLGQFMEIVDFLMGDKGHWTETLTLKIVDHDEEV